MFLSFDLHISCLDLELGQILSWLVCVFQNSYCFGHFYVHDSLTNSHHVFKKNCCYYYYSYLKTTSMSRKELVVFVEEVLVVVRICYKKIKHFMILLFISKLLQP